MRKMISTAPLKILAAAAIRDAQDKRTIRMAWERQNVNRTYRKNTPGEKWK